MCGCDALHKHNNAFNFERTHKHISTQRERESKEKKSTYHITLYSFINFVGCLLFMPSWMPEDTKNTMQLREYLHGNSINQVIYELQFVLLLQLRKTYETNNMKFIVAVIRHWATVRAPDLSTTCWREQKMVFRTKHTNQTLCVHCATRTHKQMQQSFSSVDTLHYLISIVSWTVFAKYTICWRGN